MCQTACFGGVFLDSPKSIFLGLQRRHRAPKMRGNCFFLIEPTPSAQIEMTQIGTSGGTTERPNLRDNTPNYRPNVLGIQQRRRAPKMSDQRAQPTMSLSTQNLTAVLNGTLERPNLPLPKPFGPRHRAPPQILVVAFYFGVTVPPLN